MKPPLLPRQAASPDEGGGGGGGGGAPQPPAEDRRHVVRRRWITAIIILLLVGVPAGYLVVSAQQSRESGRDKAAKVGAVHVRPAWPSTVQRSIYEVPIPDKAWRVGYLETNNWHTSRLYTEFTVTARDLEAFLAEVGTSRDALTPGPRATRSPGTTRGPRAGRGNRAPPCPGSPSNSPTRAPPGTSRSTSAGPTPGCTWSPPRPRSAR